ncbi:hypothetical protein TI39_contig377g00015 [Zymoseptoria brevis]|uniref:RING-type domain-containing protein n=1 Tax=Zymoseptoria brevis TaxID=1047168 RepID=A0A0F4GS86_9PEZI|nr:hypothetical protein TI39_contig377g00015 [Zymoseptoria brevis]
MSSTTSAAPAATTTGSTEKHDSKSNSNNPLLFFVALGFGVVFTNLWIIVGVKYCFRYNARNRAARILNEHGDPIDLDNMPPGHRRRRKEKKLMSMQEVNERFPLTKYKAFRSSREAVGVPEGGVPTSPSRPASVRRVEDVNSSMGGGTVADTAPPQTALAIAQQDHAEAIIGDSNTNKPTPQATTSTDLVAEKNDTAVRSSSVGTGDDDDEDDPIRTAAPAEMLDVPGDTCAICIDTLDDDDDVRGLTCGHAFHGSCVDPWLTSRRACCPLCKADYYVPKPRDAAADGERGSMPTYPSHTWIGPGGFRPHMILTSRGFFLGDQVQERMNGPGGARRNHAARTTNTTTNGAARPGFFGRWRPGAQSATTTTPTAETTNASTDPTITTHTQPTSTWRSMLPRLRRGEESRTQEAQLEAGTRTVR